jgi:hypothetical protein
MTSKRVDSWREIADEVEGGRNGQSREGELQMSRTNVGEIKAIIKKAKMWRYVEVLLLISSKCSRWLSVFGTEKTPPLLQIVKGHTQWKRRLITTHGNDHPQKEVGWIPSTVVTFQLDRWENCLLSLL